MIPSVVGRLPARRTGRTATRNGGTAVKAATVRVGQLDVASAGAPVWVVAGPVHQDAGSRAGAVLDELAKRGAQFRVGLQPSPNTRRWRYTEMPSLNAKATVDMSGCATAQQVLDRVVGQPVAAPISVGQAGEYLCVRFDHGIGDAHLMTETLAALSHATDGLVAPPPAPTVANPVRVAIGHNLKAGLSEVTRQAVGLAQAGRSFPSVAGQAGVCREEAAAPAAGEPGDADRPAGYHAVFVKSEDHFADQVRAWRDATGGRASLTALLMWSICRALRDAGVTLADDCGVLVDLRRFLPAGARTLANLCTVARVRGGADTSYEKFSAELRATAESVGPLVKLAAYLASTRVCAAIRGRRGQPWWVAGSSQGSAVHLTILDISKMPALAKIAWTRPMDAELAVALPPGSPAHLSTALHITASGSVQVTATFPASLVAVDTVRNALRAALTLENFCAPTELASLTDETGAA